MRKAFGGRSFFRRTLSLFVAFAMVVGMCPTAGVAEELLSDEPAGNEPVLVELNDTDPVMAQNRAPEENPVGMSDTSGDEELSVTAQSDPEVPVTGVTLNPTSLTLGAGGTQTLIATVEPADATDKSVAWESDNESVATVEDGVVTAVAPGTATITATTTNGSQTATCDVTVKGTLTADMFNVTLPETIPVADGTSKADSVGVALKSEYEGQVGNITVEFLHGNSLVDEPSAPGRYTFRLAVEESDSYVGATITDPTWVLYVAYDGAFAEGFENGATDWVLLDSDGDGWNWDLGSVMVSVGNSSTYSHSGSDFVTSASYDNNYGVLYPDNWAISPAIKVNENSALSFWIMGQDPNDFAEHMGLYVGTSPNIDSMQRLVEDDFVSGSRNDGYKRYLVHLEAYAGETVFFAFRHYNVSDMFRLNLDDVKVYAITLSATEEEGETLVYTGSALAPTLVVTDGVDDLAEGVDYDVAFVDADSTAYADGPVEVGEYKAVLTFKGDYSGTAEVEFEILPAQLTDVSVTQTSPLEYSGESQTPQLSESAVSVNDQPVTFTYSRAENGEYGQLPAMTDVRDAGTFYFKASAPNHKDSVGTVTITMNKGASSVTKAPAANELTYKSTAQPLVTEGTASGGTMLYALGDTVPTDGNAWGESVPTAIDAGAYHVWYRVAGDDNHEGVAVAGPVDVTIAKADLSKASVTLAKTSCSYTGRAKKPAVESVTLDGRELVAGTDYSVRYKNNVELGIATAIVSGKGNYKGAAKANFRIVPAKVRGFSTAGHPSQGTLDASWDAVSAATSYQLSWRRAGGKWKSMEVADTGATIEGLAANRSYEVRVRAKTGSAKGEWSKVANRWLRKVSSPKAVAGKSRGSIKVTWAASKVATGGYEVHVCKDKGGAIVAKKTVAAGKTSVTIGGLKSGRAYSVRVRPLREASGTIYVGVLRYCTSAVEAR